MLQLIDSAQLRSSLDTAGTVTAGTQGLGQRHDILLRVIQLDNGHTANGGNALVDVRHCFLPPNTYFIFHGKLLYFIHFFPVTCFPTFLADIRRKQWIFWDIIPK